MSQDGGGLDVSTDNCICVEEIASLTTNVDYIHIYINLSQFIYYTTPDSSKGRLWWEVGEDAIGSAPQVPVLCPGWSAVSAQDSAAWYMNG